MRCAVSWSASRLGEMEAKIQTGGDAATRDALVDANPRAHRSRPEVGQIVVRCPVRGRLVTVEQAGRAQNESPGSPRGHVPCLQALPPHE